MKYMMEYDKLRCMELHSTMELNWGTVLRVYNGWIYYRICMNDIGVFVPEYVDVNAEEVSFDRSSH